MKEWKVFTLETGTFEKQYINPEEPYINEMEMFITAVKNKNRSLFSNSLLEDYNVLQTLYECEDLSE